MTIPTELKFKISKEYLENKLTMTELANKYNVGRASIIRICKDYIPDNDRRKSGFAHNRHRISVDENYFENIDSPNKAYWLGFIAADGWVSSDENNPVMSIGLSIKDLNHLEKFKNDLKSTGKITQSCSLHKITGKYYATCAFSVRRLKFWNDLIKHGIIPNKSKELNFPNISDDLLKHYIRGYFDGDGCWTTDKQNTMSFGIVSSVENFCIKIRNCIKKQCQLESDVKITLHNNAYHFIYRDNLQTKRIYDYLYSDGGPWLDRKFEKSSAHFKARQEVELSQDP